MQKQPTRQAPVFRQTTRAGVRERLIRSGLAHVEAERWCDEWERHAASQGILSSRDYFWDAGRGWIDANRVFSKSLR